MLFYFTGILGVFAYNVTSFCLTEEFYFSGTAGFGARVQQHVSPGDGPSIGRGDLCTPSRQIPSTVTFSSQAGTEQLKSCNVLFSLPAGWRWKIISTLSILAQEIQSSRGRGGPGDDGRLHGNATRRLPHAIHVYASLYEFGSQEATPTWRFVILTSLLWWVFSVCD